MHEAAPQILCVTQLATSLSCVCVQSVYLVFGLRRFLSATRLKWSLTGHWTNRSGLNTGGGG